MAVSPLPPGLAGAIASFQALRDRQAARKAAFPAQADGPPQPAPAIPQRRGRGTPGTERLNRPVPIRDAVRPWWNWD